jgi:hypothetical protein
MIRFTLHIPFIDHLDRVLGTDLGTDATAFAVVKINLHHAVILFLAGGYDIGGAVFLAHTAQNAGFAIHNRPDNPPGTGPGTAEHQGAGAQNRFLSFCYRIHIGHEKYRLLGHSLETI